MTVDVGVAAAAAMVVFAVLSPKSSITSQFFKKVLSFPFCSGNSQLSLTIFLLQGKKILPL